MRLFVSFLIVLMIGCSVFAQDRTADLVVLNGNVLTMDEKRPQAEAIAVAGNKISAVGTNAEIRTMVGETTKVIDAKGGTVIPGFNDAHVHFMAIGNTFSSMDIKDIDTPEKLAERLRYYARFLPKGRWILGSGGNDALWKVDAAMLAKALDESAPDNPVFLYHTDPASALANAAAMKKGGVKLSAGGIVRGGALERVRFSVPKDHTKRWAEIAGTASNYAASLGITSVQDVHSDDMAAVYRELESQGKLKTRIYDCRSLPEVVKEKAIPKRSDADAMVRTGCVKGMHEGDDDWTPKLETDIIAADKLGWQIAIHAIGKGPTQAVIEIFAAAIKENGERDRRFKLEHAEGVSVDDIKRAGKLNIIASIQPYLFGRGAGFGSGYYTDLQKAGMRLAYGSDAPMTAFDPLLTVNVPSVSVISDHEVIKGYTQGSAYAEFAENIKGTITPGKLADIVILSEKMSEQKTNGMKVFVTITNGKVVYGH
ncbi:MAG: amidohydrolase family protein [Acidobacteria bacterium]|nr:amidohydrolase family protein [Acidobacteriota bacterium]